MPKLNQILTIKLVYIFTRVGFWLPALYFYLTDIKDFPAEHVLLGIGVTALLTSIFEVPTGVVADKISRRLSLNIGSGLKVFAFFFFIFSNSYLLFFLGILLRSLGGSFVSGADESLLYDQLKSQGREEEFQAQIRSLKGWHLIQVTITVFLGSLLINWGLVWPLVATIFTYIFGFAASLFVKDVPLTEEGEELIEQDYISHLKESVRVVLSRDAILSGLSFFTLAGAVIYALASSNKDLYLPIMENLSDNYSLIGLLTSALIGVRVIGYFIPQKLIDKVIPGKFAQLNTFVVYILGFVLAIFIENIFVFAIVIAISVFPEGIYRPIFKQLYNKALPSRYRSTLLSLQSLIQNIIAMIIVSGFGYITSFSNYKWGIVLVISVAITGALSSYIYQIRQR